MPEPASIVELAQEMIRLLYHKDTLPQFIGEVLGKEGVVMVLFGDDVQLRCAIDGEVDKASKNARLYEAVSKLLEDGIRPLMEKISLEAASNTPPSNEVPKLEN